MVYKKKKEELESDLESELEEELERHGDFKNHRFEDIFSIEIRYYFKIICLIVFCLCFLTSVGYWLYQTISIYNEKLSLKTLEDIFERSVHHTVGFEGALLCLGLIYAVNQIRI